MLQLSGDAVRPSVLVPEKLSPDGLALLKSTLDVHEKRNLSPDELLKIIPDYQALLVRSETKVTAEVLQAGKNLKVVGRAGVGVDNVGETSFPFLSNYFIYVSKSISLLISCIFCSFEYTDVIPVSTVSPMQMALYHWALKHNSDSTLVFR